LPRRREGFKAGALEEAFVGGGGFPIEEVGNEADVGFLGEGGVGEAERVTDGGDGVGGGAFDFDEAAEASDVVEADFAVLDVVEDAAFFEGEGGGEAELLEEGGGGGEVGDGEFEFEAVFEGGVGIAGAFVCNEVGGFIGVEVGLLAEAQADVGVAEGVVGAIEEGVALEETAVRREAEGVETGKEGVMGVESEFGFDFSRHGGIVERRERNGTADFRGKKKKI